ncbi:DsbA family protein [Corynebacterium callunae]|uniref:DsbA family protein n=1 Tax=Corynebacterium callunae TaxID=1721 RepID=UPI003981C959
MSNKVQNPTQGGSKNFLWALVAIVVIAIVVVGFIVVNGQGNKAALFADREFQDTTMTMEVSEDSITLSSPDAKADAEIVQLYEDYSCPHCAELAEATDAEMKSEIEAGNLIVEIKPLNFLDRDNIDGHSTHSLAAALAVADTNDAQMYWNFRTFLLEEQDEIANIWSDEDFADALEAKGVDSATVETVRNSDNVQRAYDLGTANGEELTETTGSLSSPRVLQDGKDVDVADISQWIPAVLGS